MMDDTDTIQLTQEYIQRLRKIKYWFLHAMGFGRYSIVDNRIVGKTWNSVFYGIFVIIINMITISHVIYETTVRTHYISNTELVIILELTIIINLFLLDITFGNRFYVARLIEHSIDIDVILGISDTKFMRDIIDTAYTYMGVPIFLMQSTVILFLYIAFEVSLLVHITGSLYFFWAFFVFCDINFLINHMSILNLRVRYVNVAAMKAMKIKVEYIPDLFLFNGIFWKAKHNELVTFHTKADEKKFAKVYKMMFTHLQLFQQAYQFSIFIGMSVIIIGSLLSVQIMILHGKTGINMMRKFIMISWLMLSWLFLTLLSFLVDIFSRQIEQTKLICTYAQLKCISNEAVYKFTKTILRALEVREARASIFSLCYFDPGVMLRIAASTFVYITAQLQISMPATDVIHHRENITSTN